MCDKKEFDFLFEQLQWCGGGGGENQRSKNLCWFDCVYAAVSWFKNLRYIYVNSSWFLNKIAKHARTSNIWFSLWLFAAKLLGTKLLTVFNEFESKSDAKSAFFFQGIVVLNATRAL